MYWLADLPDDIDYQGEQDEDGGNVAKKSNIVRFQSRGGGETEGKWYTDTKQVQQRAKHLHDIIIYEQEEKK